MVSFVIVSKDKSAQELYVTQFCTTHNISSYDQIRQTKDLSKKPLTQSIGIDDIKDLQKKVFLKPLQSTDKAIILPEADSLTTEAQNALLKTLEEPPAHTFVFLLASYKHTLLPTILSRCQIIQLDNDSLHDYTDDTVQFFQTLRNVTAGDKLFIADKLGKQKAAAIDWLENGLHITHTIVKVACEENNSEKLTFYSQVANVLQKTLHDLQNTNVNTRLAIEHALLTIQ